MTKTQGHLPTHPLWPRFVVWALVATGMLLQPCCTPMERTPIALTAIGTDVLLPDGLALVVPNAYHETPSLRTKTYHMRGGAKPSYDTIVIERREEGGPTLLDGAIETALSRLEDLDNFDLLDVQMSFVGPYLALSYAADFTHLEVPRRQWGMVIGTDRGAVALFMTSPKDAFNEASEDYLSVLHSLHLSHTPSPLTTKEAT